MKVHGCVAGKEVRCDLPIEEVVRLGIDPWRLDLMDPDPVIVEVCGKPIAFSRLADVVFAYTTDDTVFVGVHDGSKTVCLYGDASQCAEGVEVRGFKVSSKRFEEHLADYLKAANATYETGTLHYKSGGFVIEAKFFPINPSTPLEKAPVTKFYSPAPSSSLEVCGDKLVFLPDTEVLDHFQYRGRTNELQTFNGVQLPDELNWVHRTLGAFKPTIISIGMLQALRGGTPSRVDVLLEYGQLPGVRSFLQNQPDVEVISGLLSECMFKHRGCAYNFFEEVEENDYFGDGYTVESIRSTAVNQVSGTRIGFADFGARLLRRNSPVHIRSDMFPLIIELYGFTEVEVENIK